MAEIREADTFMVFSGLLGKSDEMYKNCKRLTAIIDSKGRLKELMDKQTHTESHSDYFDICDSEGWQVCNDEDILKYLTISGQILEVKKILEIS